MIDTHIHLDVEDYAEDLSEVIMRAKACGVEKVVLPAVDLQSCHSVLDVASRYPGFAYPMLGLHPEEVKADFVSQLDKIRILLDDSLSKNLPVVAIGEVGLDYYWSREFEYEQLEAFRRQVEWSIQYRLPLAIHCRKAQNEMVHLLNEYKKDLPGGIFHCFTGNEYEARQLLQFDNFMLGIGGVLTFKKSHLPEVLALSVPLERIVIETDGPYMAPVPMRGKRNESAFLVYIVKKLAEAYGVEEDVINQVTTANARKIVNI